MLCADKLPESTGDKLTAWGDGFQLSWGTRLDSLGEVLNCIGEVTPLNVWYTTGEQSLGQDCRGCLLRIHVYMLLGNVGLCGRIPNLLKIDYNFARGECTDLLAHSLGDWCLVMFFG